MKRLVLKQLWLSITAMFFIAGCDSYSTIGPDCVDPVDDFKLAVTKSVPADSADWVNTNITLSSGDTVEMQLVGSSDSIPVTLCGRHVYSGDSSSALGKITFDIDSESEAWIPTPSPIGWIRNGDKVFLNIGSPSSTGGIPGNKWSYWDETTNCDYPGSGGIACGSGTGTGSVPWDDDLDEFSEENNACIYPEFGTRSDTSKKCWHVYGTKTQYRINSTTATSGVTVTSAVYDLVPSNIDTANSINIDDLSSSLRGYIEIDVPKDGYMQFRMDDCAGCYYNNIGGYSDVEISHYGCPRQNGEGLVAYIGDATPDSGTTPTLDSNFFTEDSDSGDWVYENDSTPAGTLWLKIDDPDGDYSAYGSEANEGEYLVSIKLYSNSCEITPSNPSCDPNAPNDITSTAVEYVVDNIEEVLRNAQQDVFEGLAGTSGSNVGALVNFIRACLILYIGIYGVLFAFGMIQSPQMDFIVRVIKVAIIIQLLGPNAWNFFNEYFFSIFTDGVKYIIYILNNLFDTETIYGTGDVWVDNMVAGYAAGGESINFAFLDRTVGLLFESSFWIKLIGLLFAGPVGWLYIIVIVIGLIIFVKGVIKGILSYIISLIAMAMLIGVAPLFFTFMLFNQTKDLFEAWIQQVVNYALRPILIFTALAIFNFMMWAALTRLMSYGVCWKCIWNIDLGLDFLPKLCVLYFYQPMAYDNFGEATNTTMPIGFFAIFTFLIIAALLEKFIPFMEGIATSITGSTAKASILAPAASMSNDLKKPFGMDKKSVARRKEAKADDKKVAGIKRGMLDARAKAARQADVAAGGAGMAKFDQTQIASRKADLGQVAKDVAANKAAGGSVKDRAKLLEDKLKGTHMGKNEAGFGKSQLDARKAELDQLKKDVASGKGGDVKARAALLEGKLDDIKQRQDKEAGGKGMADFERGQKALRTAELEKIAQDKKDERAGGKEMADLDKQRKGELKDELKDLANRAPGTRVADRIKDAEAGGLGMAGFEKGQRDARAKELEQLKDDVAKGGSIKDRIERLEGSQDEKLKDIEAGGRGMAAFEEGQQGAREKELDALQGDTAKERAEELQRRLEEGSGGSDFQKSQVQERYDELEGLKGGKSIEERGKDLEAGGEGMSQFDKDRKQEQTEEKNKLGKKNEDE